MVTCPLCGREREYLSKNGFCSPCPEYDDWIRKTRPRTLSSGTRRRKLHYGPLIQKPSGRSGKLEGNVKPPESGGFTINRVGKGQC